ncbi:hypothetical protein U1Q18_007417, partial [Sarracenia purpurea var. burkii]
PAGCVRPREIDLIELDVCWVTGRVGFSSCFLVPLGFGCFFSYLFPSCFCCLLSFGTALFCLVAVISCCAGFPAACLSVGAATAALPLLGLSSLGQLLFLLSVFKGDSNCLLGFSLQAAYCRCPSQFAAGFRGMLRLFGLAEVWPCACFEVFHQRFGHAWLIFWAASAPVCGALFFAPACFSSWSCCSFLVLP